MPRKNQNHSNYHYRSEITDHDGNTKVKYYYTLKEMCDEFNTSTFTIYRIIKNNIKPNNKNLQNVKLFKDYKPVMKLVKNELF